MALGNETSEIKVFLNKAKEKMFAIKSAWEGRLGGWIMRGRERPTWAPAWAHSWTEVLGKFQPIAHQLIPTTTTISKKSLQKNFKGILEADSWIFLI